MQDSNRLVPYFTVYYYIYFVFGITFQSTLFFLIVRKSPPSLESLRYFLYNTCVVQMLVIVLGYYTQNRSLPNLTSLAVLPGGPCKKFGPYACFTGYHIFLAVSMCVAISISNTVVFRFMVLKFNSLRKKHLLMMISGSHIPSIILAILPFLDKWDFVKVRELTYQEHPTYNLSIYEPFPGFSDITTVPFLTATTLVAIGAYGIPTCSAVITRVILKMINENRNMSTKTKITARLLVYGLACQTLLPLVSYVPIVSLYLISQITGEEMLLTEHFLQLCSGFPALVDPFISFYFIVPYRHAIYRFVTRKSYEQRLETMVVSTISTRSNNLQPRSHDVHVQ